MRTYQIALKWLLNWESNNKSQYYVWKAELETFVMWVEYIERQGSHKILQPFTSTRPFKMIGN